MLPKIHQLSPPVIECGRLAIMRITLVPLIWFSAAGGEGSTHIPVKTESRKTASHIPLLWHDVAGPGFHLSQSLRGVCWSAQDLGAGSFSSRFSLAVCRSNVVLVVSSRRNNKEKHNGVHYLRFTALPPHTHHLLLYNFEFFDPEFVFAFVLVWCSIPEAGAQVKRPKISSRTEKFTPVPDSIIQSSRSASHGAVDMGGVDTPMTPVGGTATPSSSIMQLGSARGKVRTVSAHCVLFLFEKSC